MTGFSKMLRSGAGILTLALMLTAVPMSPSRAFASEAVTIYRDAFGVPHVVAATDDAVMFGAGYALAQDRLAGMELSRRAAAGRRAEILGASAVTSDKVARDRRISDAELMRMYDALEPEYQSMIQAYVDGINRAIDEVNADPGNKIPYEFTQWGIRPTPWRLTEYLAYVSSFPNGRDTTEITNLKFLKEMTERYGPDIGWRIFNDVVPISDPDSPTVIKPGEDLAPKRPDLSPVRSKRQLDGKLAAVDAPAGTLRTDLPREASRCLVIGPEKSASGKVMMLQATADGPEVHLKGGGFDTAGFNFNGWGIPAMGRGVQHGWLMVSGTSQASSVYAEKLNPENQYEYWHQGAWRKMEHRSETILVKDAPAVTHEVAWTVHGPVVAWDVEGGVAYSHKMAQRGYELDTWVAILELGRARNFAELKKKAVDRMAWNVGVCYGGEDGRIAYFEAGRLPVKPANADPRLPVPGTGEFEWAGFLKPAQKPAVVNPKQGYIFAWNSKATSWSQEGNYGRIGKTFRTWLGDRLASSGSSLTLLDMREFNRKMFNALGAVDRNQTSPDFFAPYLRKAIEATSDADVKRAARLMIGFNGLYEDRDADYYYDNAGLTLFRTWLAVAPEMLFGDDIGEWWRAIDEDRYLTYQTSLLLRALEGDDAGAPLEFDYFNGRDRETFMIESIQATISMLEKRFPDKAMDEWRLPVYWKYFNSAHKASDRPALDDSDQKDRLWSILGLGPAMAPHNGGESWVGLMAVDRDHRALYSVVDAGGQNQFIDPNGNGNPHLTDQAMMHETNELKKIPLRLDEIRTSALSETVLTYSP